MLVIAASAFALCAARAEPIVPQHDDEVVETLPAGGNRAEERRLRAQADGDPARAVALARRYLDQARAQGDPRLAGRALAALRAWPDADTAPDDVLLMRATIEQHLHDFDAAAARLERLVQRRPQHAQAWLTLATVRRVQGRYADSDRACGTLARAGAPFHAAACQAENTGLRGELDAARRSLRTLLAAPRLPAESRAWLLTTLAELEARADRPVDADAAYRAALAAQRDDYTALSYADFLLAQARAAEALAMLKEAPRTDAVLLRVAIAGARAGVATAARDAAELRERMALAGLRPDVRTTHAREQAMLALWVDGDAARAVPLARANLRLQREPLDVLLLAVSARTAGDAAALRECTMLVKEMGLHDQRLDALL
jgi:tetratricopeptide (TPR) repeat protein